MDLRLFPKAYSVPSKIQPRFGVGVLETSTSSAKPLDQNLSHKGLPKSFGTIGLSQVKFGNQTLNQAQLDEINSQLNDINTYVRLAALKKLFDQPQLTDKRILRTLGRYIYYNDTYTPESSPRVQARLWAIKVMEKHANTWGVEGLFNTLREVGNRKIASYSALVLGKSLEVSPDWIADRTRARLYDWIISDNSGGASDLSSKLMSTLGPGKDANYLWFLLNSTTPSSGGEFSSSVRSRLSKTLAGVLMRDVKPQKAADFFQSVYNDYLPIVDNSPKTLAEKNEKKLMESLLGYLPEYVDLQDTSVSAKEAKALFDIAIDLVKRLGSSDVFDSDTKKGLFKVLSKLALKTGSEDRRTTSNQLIDFAFEQSAGHSNRIETLTTVFEVLLDGKVSRRDIQEEYLNSAVGDNPYSDREIRKERWTERFRANVDQWRQNQRNPLLVSTYRPITTDIEERLLGRDTVIRKPDKINYENQSAFRFLPQEVNALVTTESLVNLKTENPDMDTAKWLSKFPLPLEPPANWPLEPFNAQEASQEVERYTLFNNQFKTALSRGNANQLQEVLMRAQSAWTLQKSRGAYDALKENIGNPKIFDSFLALLWRISEENLKKIPTRQLLGLFRESASQNPIKTESSGNLFRNLFYTLATSQPNISGDLLVTALDLMAGIPENSPALTHVGKTIFALLKFGVPDFVTEKYAPTLQRVVSQTTDYLALNSSSSRKDLDWSFFSNAIWESDSSSDSLNMDQKKNFDLAMTLASKLNHQEALTKGIQGLIAYYNRVRNSSYADEIFIIRYLRNPAIVEAGLKLEDQTQRNAFKDMLTWYKVFEAVPTMIRVASMSDVRETSWIMGTITGMDFYAVPDLEEVVNNPVSSARERDLAKEAMALIMEPKRPYEMFKPFPTALPERIQWSKRLPSLPYTPDSTPINGKPAAGPQINFPGLFEAGKDNNNTGTTTNPSQKPDQPLVTDNSPQVRFPGLTLNPTENNNGDNRRLSYLQLMDQALGQIRSTEPSARNQGLQDLVFFANQFQEVAASGRSNIAFVSPEKAAMGQQVAAALVQASQDDEKRAYLGALLSLQEPSALASLSQYLPSENNAGLQEMAVLILGSLGTSEAQPPLRTILFDAQKPLTLRTRAAEALIKLDDRETLVQLARGVDANQLTIPSELKNVGIQAIGNLRIDTEEAKSLVVSTLNTASAGSSLKSSCLLALGQIADGAEPEILQAIVNAVSDEEVAPVKLAAITAMEFLELNDLTRGMLDRLRQDGDYEVSRSAVQLLNRRSS